MKKEFITNINKIKQKYDCKGELIFRSALCLLFDYGKERCGNMDWVNDNKELTKKNHKEAEEQGKHLLVSERLEIAIMDCAYELAQFGNWELMEYIQTEIQTNWQTPTYKKLGEQIKYLCAIVKSYNGNNVSEILDEWSIDQEVLAYLELNEFIKSECWWDGTTQSTGYHDVFFTEVQLLHYVFKYYEKWGYTYWKDNGHYHIREDDNETEYTFEQCFCLVDGQLEIMYRVCGWNWSIINEEHFKSILECSQSVTLIKKENEDMKDTVIIGRGFKKYSLDNKEDIKNFFKEALCPPMFDDDNKFEKWCEENHIYILAQNGAMELPYDADVLNDLDLTLREGHEAIYGSGEASTGNTKGSEYRNATYKDLLKVEVRRIMEEHSVSYPKAIKKAYNMMGIDELLKYMEKNIECLCDEYQVNFRVFDSLLFHNLFSCSARKEALKNIVCTNIQMGEMIDKDKNHFDIVQLMDCSILPWGYMIGWHYGVSFDIDDEDNRKVIENFKKEVFE